MLKLAKKAACLQTLFDHFSLHKSEIDVQWQGPESITLRTIQFQQSRTHHGTHISIS